MLATLPFSLNFVHPLTEWGLLATGGWALYLGIKAKKTRTGTPEQLPTTWLFAGGHAGKPLSATSLGNRLRAIGIEPRKLRLSATEQLARELPPSVLAGILGLNAHTVAQHTLKTNGQWANYAADRRP